MINSKNILLIGSHHGIIPSQMRQRDCFRKQDLETYRWIIKTTAYFSDLQSFAIFVKTVIMKPFLGYISDSKKKDEFLDVFLNEYKERSDQQAWSLGFTLLNIFARK